MLKERKRPAKCISMDNPKKRKHSVLKKNFDKKSTENYSLGPSTLKKSVKFDLVKETSNKITNNIKTDNLEKTDWVKFKQEKKGLRLKRKKSKDYYEILIDLKKLFEKLRCKRTPNKSQLVTEMFSLTEKIMAKLVMAHDSARIVQCMLKYASPSLREKISESLIPVAIEMSISKYSSFCFLRMFKYGTTLSKSKLLDALFGNIVRLCCHKISCSIIDYAYLEVADAKQKNYMRQEFYSDLYKSSKDDNVEKLDDTYKDTQLMKSAILGSLKANIEHVANKKLVDNSLVHAVILEYLRESDGEKLEEIINFLSPMILMLVTTKEGCQSAIICFHHSSLKNRRVIIKTIKDHLVKICTHEHGHSFILAVLNSLDDTKAMKKAIYDTIHPELLKIISNRWGRRVIKWLLSPANTKFFHPKLIVEIEESLKYGKKEKEIRRKEILTQIEEPIAEAIVENSEFWFSNRNIGLMTAEILNKISAKNFIKAATALASVICNPSWLVEEIDKKLDVEKKGLAKKTRLSFIEKNLIPGIEEAGLHVALKQIIKNDLERQKLSETKTFGSILVENMSEQTVKQWLNVNRACFILLLIIENNSEHVTKALKNLVEPHKQLINSEQIGGKLLLQRLQL